jgi:hypothetical protein
MRGRMPAAQGARSPLPFTQCHPPPQPSLQAGDRVAVWIRDCNPDDEVLQAAVYNVAYAMKVGFLAASATVAHAVRLT